MDSKFDQLKRNFSVVKFHPNPKCTPSFESWWSTYIRRTRNESDEQILERIIGEEAIKIRRNKGFVYEIVSSMYNTFKLLIVLVDSILRQEKDGRPSKNAKRELVLPVS